jgi:hypothetical protein
MHRVQVLSLRIPLVLVLVSAEGIDTLINTYANIYANTLLVA